MHSRGKTLSLKNRNVGNSAESSDKSELVAFPVTDELLRPVDVARVLGVRPKTLANWRCSGIGPALLKLQPGSRQGAVRYRSCDITSWIAGRLPGRTTP